MQYLILLIVFLFKGTSGFSQEINFTLNGRINKDSKARVVIIQGSGLNKEIPISPNKEFSYIGSLEEAEEVFIKTDNSFAWTLWVTDGVIDVTLQEWEMEEPDPSGKKLLKITGISGPAETEKLQWLLDNRNQIGKLHPTKSITDYRDTMAKYFDPFIEQYIKSHPSSKFSANIIRLVSSKENKAKFLDLIDKDFTIEQTERLYKSIERDKVTKAGTTIEDFKMENIRGQLFSLSSFSSKYTLLDFWASWCQPCRGLHPELIKIYNSFRSKGFEIVSISLDDSKRAWKKAVKKDKLKWTQISELKGWESSLAKRFFIHGIPFNILIDENYRVVAKDLNPFALDQKLNELLNK